MQIIKMRVRHQAPFWILYILFQTIEIPADDTAVEHSQLKQLIV